MNGQKDQNFAACAHNHVDRVTVQNNGVVFEEQWRCRDCGTKFVTLESLFAGPQKIQIMQPMKTLRDEFAMASLNALVYANPKRDRKLIVDDAYFLADGMLEGRK